MSKRKEKHYLKLKNAYESALNEVEENEGLKLKKYEDKIIKNGCFHPNTYESRRDCDDGYGRWWTVNIVCCRVCGEQWRKPFEE